MSITRPLTSVKTRNTRLIIGGLPAQENWKLWVLSKLYCEQICHVYVKVIQIDLEHLQEAGKMINCAPQCLNNIDILIGEALNTLYLISQITLWSSGSWTDATFIIWFSRSVKYFQFPWRDDMAGIDIGISSLWSNSDKKLGAWNNAIYSIFYHFQLGEDVGYGWCM